MSMMHMMRTPAMIEFVAELRYSYSRHATFYVRLLWSVCGCDRVIFESAVYHEVGDKMTLAS